MREWTVIAAACAAGVVAACGPKPGPEVVNAWEEAHQEAYTEPQPGVASQFDTPDRSEAGESFGIEIERTYKGVDEAHLIAVAEGIQPDRNEVLTAIGPPGMQAEAGVEPDAALWWFATFDGIRIPWAITADALDYYVMVIEAFEKGDFSSSKGITMLKAFLRYEASVESLEEYQLGGVKHENVQVVHMELSWSQYCGPECAMGFFKKRTVVFDDQGNVVAVLDDGLTQYVVS